MRALLLGGGGDGDDVVLAGVERARHAADGAALSRGVVPLEHEDARDVREAPVRGEGVEPALERGEPLVVLLVAEREGEVELLDDALLVDRRRRGRRRADRRGALALIEALLEGVPQ